MTITAPGRATSRSLPYPDANACPWPLNHHAYVLACADALVEEIPDVTETPVVKLPEAHSQCKHVRTAQIRVAVSDASWLLEWDELTGWSSHTLELVIGAGPLLRPKSLARAFTGLITGGERMAALHRERRLLAHPHSAVFEARLAQYRHPLL